MATVIGPYMPQFGALSSAPSQCVALIVRNHAKLFRASGFYDAKRFTVE